MGNKYLFNKLGDLNKRLKAKEYKRRRLGRVDFELGEDFKIGVAFYSLIIKNKKPNSVLVDPKDNTIIKSTGNYLC